jgi:hypothetical protein
MFQSGEMKSILKSTLKLIAIAGFVISCGVEPTPEEKMKVMLIGSWNIYELQTAEPGVFVPGVTTGLTLLYESGIFFTDDGKFGPRYYNLFTEVWTQGGAIDSYEIKGNTIDLTFSPGTKDELVLTLQILRLDENHLWFSHDFFGGTEYHLEREDPML